MAEQTDTRKPIGWDGELIEAGDLVYDVANGFWGRVVSVGALSASIMVGLYVTINTATVFLSREKPSIMPFRTYHEGLYNQLEFFARKNDCSDTEINRAKFITAHALQRYLYSNLELVEGLCERGYKLDDACALLENWSDYNYSFWARKEESLYKAPDFES